MSRLTIGKFENIQHTHRYTINDKELEHVSVERDLSVLIDEIVTFEDHIMEKGNTANGIIVHNHCPPTPWNTVPLFGAHI